MSNESADNTTIVTEKKPRRTAVEAAKARLEAAENRERLGLLKRASSKLKEAMVLMAVADVNVRLDCMDHASTHSASDVLFEICSAIDEELSK